MADNALKSPSDVIDLLTDQHEQIKSLFTETLVLAGDERVRAFRDLRRLLAVHETAEEEIVHPRAKQKLPGGEQIVDARLEEENEAKGALAELESLDIDSKDITSKLTKLRDAVIAHAEHEEAEEFAELGAELSPKELERLGQIAKLAEAVAPTRPHPGVESQAANLIVGPFAAMLDRVRDVVEAAR
jgi:hemerythrin superfamily protein